ncbi:Gp19/Gp15/Gp42 family protein [Mycolicibacterium mageritense]|uniref:Head-to-tail adaptor n=1 Tax=Mycolicibacterium mageritense TaxID=53462 RepID=A0AAI8TS35_MYCME|nr:Gp19/Gp15/Gp42 family protein [Mycolicibacterium mageritense]BDY27532.1 hypothetical protein hbim_01456 [Mycolicibacterium mageritense]
MAYAEPSDVEARLGRPLTTEETTQVTTLLNDVELIIRDKIPDLDDRVTAGSPTESTVIMVEASAVVRLVRNPDGVTSENDGDYGYQLNWRYNTGQLELTDREWSLLGVSGAVSAFDVRPRTPFERAAAAAEAAGIHPFALGYGYAGPSGFGWEPLP